MGKKLTVNIFLPDPDEELGGLVSFKAGEELPAWAEDLVGDHVFAEPGEVKKTKRGRVPNVPKKPVESRQVEIPSRGAGVAKWKSFAKNEAKIEDLPQSITREEIIERVLQVMPDLEIPEGE